MDKKQDQILEDDEKDSISLLIKLRLPWLIVGLIGGIAATFLSAQFESVLTKDIHLAFFIPIIVYMADALGTQTENVYVRNVAREKIHFGKYLIKETMLGLSLGTLFGFISGFFAYVWLRDLNLAITVGLALLITMSLSPLVALAVPSILQYEKKDPAVGAGPMTTVIQDILSLFIYFSVATLILNV